MQSQGLTPSSLTIDGLRQMNLREYPDTPPSSDQAKLKANMKTTKHGEDKLTKLPAIQVLKKSQTFMGTTDPGNTKVTTPKRYTLSAAAVSSES